MSNNTNRNKQLHLTRPVATYYMILCTVKNEDGEEQVYYYDFLLQKWYTFFRPTALHTDRSAVNDLLSELSSILKDMSITLIKPPHVRTLSLFIHPQQEYKEALSA